MYDLLFAVKSNCCIPECSVAFRIYPERVFHKRTASVILADKIILSTIFSAILILKQRRTSAETAGISFYIKRVSNPLYVKTSSISNRYIAKQKYIRMLFIKIDTLPDKKHNMMILFRRIRQKRFAKSFYCKMPLLKTDASRFVSVPEERSEKLSVRQKCLTHRIL